MESSGECSWNSDMSKLQECIQFGTKKNLPPSPPSHPHPYTLPLPPLVTIIVNHRDLSSTTTTIIIITAIIT